MDGGAARLFSRDGGLEEFTETQQSGYAPRPGLEVKNGRSSDQRSKIEEVVPKVERQKGLDAGQSRRNDCIVGRLSSFQITCTQSEVTKLTFKSSFNMSITRQSCFEVMPLIRCKPNIVKIQNHRISSEKRHQTIKISSSITKFNKVVSEFSNSLLQKIDNERAISLNDTNMTVTQYEYKSAI